MNDDAKKSAEEAAARADAHRDHMKEQAQMDQDESLPWSDPDYATTTAADAAADTDDAESHLEELDRLRVENGELRDRVLHVLADMENLRRRTEREKQDSAKYAISKFAQDIVGVADNLSRAIQSLGNDGENHGPDALANLVSGVDLTDRELHNVLSRHGVIKLNPEGEKFDPNFHQAMFEVENKDVPNRTVTQVVQAGYQIGDRVLRPAMVGVAKGGPKLETPATGASAPSEQTGQPGSGTTAAGDDATGQTVDKSA